jgi:peptidoglycan hydrolase FlgJ
MNISSLKPHPQRTGIPLEQLATNKSLPEDQKVQEASRQFEAVLLRQILSESQKPVIRSKLNTDNSTNSMYRDLVINQMAEHMSQGEGVGLGSQLAQQLSSRNPNKTSAGS